MSPDWQYGQDIRAERSAAAAFERNDNHNAHTRTIVRPFWAPQRPYVDQAFFGGPRMLREESATQPAAAEFTLCQTMEENESSPS